MVASFNNSSRMHAWLQRVVKDRGGKVLLAQELAEFAKLTFEDGRPTLDFDGSRRHDCDENQGTPPPTLLEELHDRPWIKWSPVKKKRCLEGHNLELIGAASYNGSYLWRCDGTSGLGCPVISRSNQGLHLGVQRYHCPHCKINLCKTCVVKDTEPSMISKLMVVMVPSAVLATIQELLRGKEELLKCFKHQLTQFLQRLDALLDPRQTALARNVSIFLFVSSLALLAGVRYSWWILQTLGRPLLFFVGTAAIVHNTEPARRLKTVWKANWDYMELRLLRAAGGPLDWAFFVPDGTMCII